MSYSTGTAQAATFASSISFAFDVGSSNANKKIMLMARVQSSTTPNPTTATVGGNSMTAFGAAFSGISTYKYRAYYLDGSSLSGSQTVVVNYDSAAGKPDVLVVVYDDAGAVANYATSTANTLSPSWSFTTATDRVCVVLTALDTASTVTATPPVTKQFDSTTSGGTRWICVDNVATSSSCTVSLSSGSPTPSWTSVQFDIEAVGGGGGTVPRMAMMGFG